MGFTSEANGAAHADGPPIEQIVRAFQRAGFENIVANRSDAPFLVPGTKPSINYYASFAANYTHDVNGNAAVASELNHLNMQWAGAIYTFSQDGRPERAKAARLTHVPAEVQRSFQENLNQKSIAQHFVLWYLIGCRLLDGSDLHLQVSPDGKINVVLAVHEGYFGIGDKAHDQNKTPHIIHGLPSKCVPEMGKFFDNVKCDTLIEGLRGKVSADIIEGLKSRCEELGRFNWAEHTPLNIFIQLCDSHGIKRMGKPLGSLSCAKPDSIYLTNEDTQLSFYTKGHAGVPTVSNVNGMTVFTCPPNETLLQALAGVGPFADKTLMISGTEQAYTAALRESMGLVFDQHQPKGVAIPTVEEMSEMFREMGIPFRINPPEPVVAKVPSASADARTDNS